MIELPLVTGGMCYLNPDYLVQILDNNDGTCVVVQDYPTGVATFRVALPARRVAQIINRTDE